MSYGISPQCFECRRLRGIIPKVGWSCEAFGDKPIPKDILVNAADHREPYPGDGGLRFLDKDVLGIILARIDAAGFVEMGRVALSPSTSDSGISDTEVMPIVHGKGPARAAGIMFQAPDGAILMLRRTDPAHPGAWAFPGGGIEGDETAEEAARREAIEEVGPHYYGDLEPWTRRIKDGVDFTTFRQSVPERFEPVLNNEHDAHVWINPKEIFEGDVAVDVNQIDTNEFAKIAT